MHISSYRRSFCVVDSSSGVLHNFKAQFRDFSNTAKYDARRTADVTYSRTRWEKHLNDVRLEGHDFERDNLHCNTQYFLSICLEFKPQRFYKSSHFHIVSV